VRFIKVILNAVDKLVSVSDVAELGLSKMDTNLSVNLSVSRVSSYPKKTTAVVGLNRIGVSAYQRIKDQLKPSEHLVGIIDIHNREFKPNGKWRDIKYLGVLKDFPQIAKSSNINHIIVAIDPEDISQIHQVIKYCQLSQIRYEFAPEIQDVVFGHTIKQIFDDLHRPWQPNRRQIVDSLIAIMLMVFLLPIFFVVSLLIKLDSKGPVFYSQERIGKAGRIFRVFKFRTMYIDAEKFSGPVLAVKNDPRITKVGRFLRKTRLDEIPQLMNVAIGDMSFIGPRPERPYFVEKYSHEIPLYKNRLKVKPGITGLAQVTTGYDSDLDDVKDKLKHDLVYVENFHSLKLNFQILIKTMKVVLTAQGQ
jgi:exopolysaccharide biosynthesis polyprenyl glycosylphosphotransferase